MTAPHDICSLQSAPCTSAEHAPATITAAGGGHRRPSRSMLATAMFTICIGATGCTTITVAGAAIGIAATAASTAVDVAVGTAKVGAKVGGKAVGLVVGDD